MTCVSQGNSTWKVSETRIGEKSGTLKILLCMFAKIWTQGKTLQINTTELFSKCNLGNILLWENLENSGKI